MKSASGQDKITSISIHDGAVHISVIPDENEGEEETKEEAPPDIAPSLFTTQAGFKVLEDGTWIAWYTNAYEDNEGEIFAEKAIADDIGRMNESDEYPELWFWHVKGTKHGQATAAAKVGRFAVAVGEFDDTPLAHAFKAYYKASGDLALSHGFFYEPEDKVNGVFNAYQTFEISVLPPDSAANPYTAYTIKEKNMAEISEKVRAALIKAIGEEETEEIIKSGKAATDVLDQIGVAYKTETPAKKGDDKPDSEEEEETDMKAFMSKMVETMSKMEQRLSKMEEGDPHEEDEKPEEEKSGKSRSEQTNAPGNDRFLQLLADAIANKDSAIEKRKQTNDTPADSLWGTLMGEGKPA